MGRIPKDKYKDNPLVPIDGARVRAAIRLQRDDRSVKATAEAIGVDHRTLDSIVQGKTLRTRESRLRGLSAFLHVSEAWLSGEDQAPVDGLPPWDLGSPVIPGEFGFHSDENFIRHRLDRKVSDAPLYQLAWARMVERVIRAWKRDLEEGVPAAQSAIDLIQGAYPDLKLWSAVSLAVQRLMAVGWFRQVCLLPADHAEGAPFIFRSREEQVLSADTWAKSVSEMLDVMLGPWFQGRQRLDYEFLVMLLRWAVAGMPTGAFMERLR